MKQKILILAIILLSSLDVARGYAQKVSIIEGKWLETAIKSIRLYEITNGSLSEISFSKIDNNGSFAFAFYPEKEGYYVIGTHEQSSVNRYVFYFKPGDKLSFEIKDSTWRLVGNNSSENKEIEKWHNLVQPLEFKSIYFMKTNSTFKDFFPELETCLEIIKSYPKAKTNNKTFNASFEDYKRYNISDIALTFLMTPRSVHPSKDDYIKFYHEISIPELTRSITFLDYPNAFSLIYKAYSTKLISDMSREKDLADKPKKIDEVLLSNKNMIYNDVVRGEYVLTLASHCKSYEDFMKLKKNYEHYLVDDDQKQRFSNIQAKLDNDPKGRPAINFKFPDINGKEIALSDYKGKVVYIDVWATWCGPCRQEIPHMIKLEKEFEKNEDLVFMSVSVDALKDYTKWKDMIKENEMKGIQLFSGNKSNEILDNYKISGIPRFILVGKDGNIIEINAPRPSSAEIRPLLETALSK